MAITLTTVIEGDKTQLLLQKYADRLLIAVTQLGKVGALIQVTMPETAPLAPTATSTFDDDFPANPMSSDDAYPSLPPPPPSIVLTPLLGASPNAHMQTLISLYVSQIATLAWHANPRDRKPVVVGIALKNTSSTTDGEEEGLGERERKVYFEIMALVAEGLDMAFPRR